eukprot:8446257-Pyramimonas_sp.AAC.1
MRHVRAAIAVRAAEDMNARDGCRAEFGWFARICCQAWERFGTMHRQLTNWLPETLFTKSEELPRERGADDSRRQFLVRYLLDPASVPASPRVSAGQRPPTSFSNVSRQL